MNVTVTLPDGTHKTLPQGSKIIDFFDTVPEDTVAARIDNKLVSLNYRVYIDASVEPVTLSSPEGYRVYERSLTALLGYALSKIEPGAKLYTLHSYNNGIYCEIEGAEVTDDFVNRLKTLMKEAVSRDLEIPVYLVDEESAVKIFKKIPGREDTVRLFEYLPEHQRICIFKIADYTEYAYIPLVHRTGILKNFDLLIRRPGVIVLLPDEKEPHRLSPLRESPKLFKTFEESSRWARILGVNDAGSLNRVITTGDVSDFIKIAEALHEKKIAQIADEITAEYRKIKLVLIAGPSSSGKTTFAKRLGIQLRVNEKNPVVISLDNYFLDRDKTPRDENGNPDYDSIEALDLELINRHLKELLEGKEIEVPKFDFKKGKRVKGGRKLKLRKGDIVVIEGIHGLNPRLSELVPEDAKFKIYVSALTQICVDSHNRISTSDTRLIRRIVRDRLFRGHSALETLQMWPNVRKNEEKYIFPFQEEADVMFNSSLVYEMAVLKLYADTVLQQVTPDHAEYADAVRLLTILSHFLGIMPTEVPPTSILREFIGGSSFKY